MNLLPDCRALLSERLEQTNCYSMEDYLKGGTTDQAHENEYPGFIQLGLKVTHLPSQTSLKDLKGDTF